MLWLFVHRFLSYGFFLLGAPFILLGQALVPKWRQGMWQRWGVGLSRLPRKDRPRIWIHAVSYGETKAIETLLGALATRFPEWQICISSGTDTGRELAKQLREVTLYLPFDFQPVMSRCFDALEPDLLLIAETEIWPEMLLTAYRRQVPAFLVNARLSAKPCYLPQVRQAAQTFCHIFAQSQADRERFLEMGVSEDRVSVTANLKFDGCHPVPVGELKEVRESLGLRSRYIIAASTHPGEDELVCEAFAAVQETGLKLLLAPRHQERVPQVERVCEQRGLRSLRRSQLPSQEDADVIVVDTMGELKMFYGLSEVALLGGTWSRVGGHNPLEAAAYGIPILSGPHLHKIHDLAVNLKEMGMFFEVPDRSAVIAKLREVLRDWEPVTFPEHWGVADRLAQEISEKLRA